MSRARKAVFLAFLGALALASPPRSEASPALGIRGQYFVDPQGRAVLLRGMNVSADSKHAPFIPLRDGRSGETDVSLLDPLPALGVNTIRVLFFWEAYEPEPGRYDEAYLDRITRLADAAWERGLYIVLDLHEDGFSRYTGSGCGVGFPRWAVPERLRQAPLPPSGADCSALWATGVAVSASMHASFHDFYADTYGVRTAFLGMWSRLARHFASHPGVIGYDVINEPWGDERRELQPLYEDVARVIHQEDPSALILVEPQVFLTTFGFRSTDLEKPFFPNAVYAPHFYDPIAEGLGVWGSLLEPVTDNGYRLMARTARKWGVPLFVGELGVPGGLSAAARFMDYQYEALDEWFASGTQWDYTPAWTPDRQDGWNHEDLSVVETGRDGRLALRRNFHPRPYAERTHGWPISQRQEHEDDGTLDEYEYVWRSPAKPGETVVYLPPGVAGDPGHWRITVRGRGLRCAWGGGPGRATCRTEAAGEQRLRIRRLR